MWCGAGQRRRSSAPIDTLRRARRVMSTARALASAFGRACSTSVNASATRGVVARETVMMSARSIGTRGVPDEYGQPKSGGTSFLGTPKNHRQLLEKRPLSPDVFDADGSWRMHYRFPAAALSSIANRVTGATLSGVVGVGGCVALVGGAEAVPMLIEAIKVNAPMSVVPLKFALSFPFAFHTLGGFRHLVWDTTTRGIDNESARMSSMVVFGASAAASAALAVYTW